MRRIKMDKEKINEKEITKKEIEQISGGFVNGQTFIGVGGCGDEKFIYVASGKCAFRDKCTAPEAQCRYR